MYVRAVLGIIDDVALDLWHHDEVELQSVERDNVRSERLATVSLQQGCGKALRVGECGHVEHVGETSVAPLLEESHPLVEIFNPTH